MKISRRLLTGFGAAMAVAMTASAYDISVRGKDGQIFQASVDNIQIMDFETAGSPLKFNGAHTNDIEGRESCPRHNRHLQCSNVLDCIRFQG